MKDEQLSVMSIISRYLSKHGAGGLCYHEHGEDSCGCGINNLVPCMESPAKCSPAVKVMCNKCKQASDCDSYHGANDGTVSGHCYQPQKEADMKNVKDIVWSHLNKIGADGLTSKESGDCVGCTCNIGDLMPPMRCVSYMPDCVPARFVKCMICEHRDVCPDYLGTDRGYCLMPYLVDSETMTWELHVAKVPKVTIVARAEISSPDYTAESLRTIAKQLIGDNEESVLQHIDPITHETWLSMTSDGGRRHVVSVKENNGKIGSITVYPENDAHLLDPIE